MYEGGRFTYIDPPIGRPLELPLLDPHIGTPMELPLLDPPALIARDALAPGVLDVLLPSVRDDKLPLSVRGVGSLSVRVAPFPSVCNILPPCVGDGRVRDTTGFDDVDGCVCGAGAGVAVTLEDVIEFCFDDF